MTHPCGLLYAGKNSQESSNRKESEGRGGRNRKESEGREGRD